MKIAFVRAIPLEAPFDPHEMVTALGVRHKAALVLVEVGTDTGLVGHGEALARFSLRSYVGVIEDVLAPRLVGRDPFTVEALWQDMFRVFSGRAGGIHMEALAACDMAIWDVMGKATGLPVHKLLGSCGRERVRAYASSISWGDDDIAAAQTERALAAGFDAIKIKIGPPVERALARAAFIRHMAGDAVELTADANSGFDFDQSVRLGRGLAELGYEWLEEPLIPEDQEGYLRLRKALPLRIALGESDHTVYDSRALIAAGAVGVIQPVPARAGGFTETRRIGLLAYAFNVPFAPHVGFCGAVCAAAGLHLAAALPNFLTYEAMTFANLMRQKLATTDVTDPALLKDGTLPVPAGPGLGIEIDPAFVARHRIDGR